MEICDSLFDEHGSKIAPVIVENVKAKGVEISSFCDFVTSSKFDVEEGKGVDAEGNKNATPWMT
eukprot:4239133-Amphidinium_carterae.1